MGKVITDEGITIEAKGDTLYISEIPDESGYAWGLFSLKWADAEMPNFPRGVWKKVRGGKAEYHLNDRGEGLHKVLISFTPERKGYPDYTVANSYSLRIDADGNVEFPA